MPSSPSAVRTTSTARSGTATMKPAMRSRMAARPTKRGKRRPGCVALAMMRPSRTPSSAKQAAQASASWSFQAAM